MYDSKKNLERSKLLPQVRQQAERNFLPATYGTPQSDAPQALLNFQNNSYSVYNYLVSLQPTARLRGVHNGR